MFQYGHAVFRCKLNCCCCLPRSYFDFIMRLSDVKSVKCTMLPLISMRLSDVKENKKICFFNNFFLLPSQNLCLFVFYSIIYYYYLCFIYVNKQITDSHVTSPCYILSLVLLVTHTDSHVTSPCYK